MKKIYIITCFIVVLSCSDNKGKNRASSIDRNEKTVVVDVDNTVEEDFINMSDYFKNVGITVLETNEHCLIGTVNMIRVVDDYIIVMDSEQTKSVFVFDKKGKFLYTVGKVGAGPDEYIEITDSSIDFKKKEIYILDISRNRINKYDLRSGRFISQITIDKKALQSYYMQYAGGKIFITATSFNKTEDFCILQEIDSNTGRQVASFLKASEYNSGWSGFLTRTEGFFYPGYAGGAKYVQMFMDTIISIGDDGIKPCLVLKAENWISKKDIQELIEYQTHNHGSLSNEILFERNISYNIHSYFEVNNIIGFQYQDGGENKFVVYDTKTNTARISGALRDDLIYKGDPTMSPTFAFADEKGVYGYTAYWQIPFLLETAHSDQLNISPAERKLLMNLPEDSNPVIFYYECK
jgi:hypothetical protein